MKNKAIKNAIEELLLQRASILEELFAIDYAEKTAIEKRQTLESHIAIIDENVSSFIYKFDSNA